MKRVFIINERMRIHGWEKNENRYERTAYDSNGSERERTATGMKENATGRKQRTL